MVRTKSNESIFEAPLSGVPSTCTSMLIGTLSGWLGSVASAWIMPILSSGPSPMPTMPPQQTLMPAIADLGQRVQAILVGSGGDDLAVKLGRGVEIVVVIIEASLLEAHGLRLRQHAEGDAAFQAERLDALDHGANRVEVAILRRAPGCAHAESARASLLGRPGFAQHRAHIHHLFSLEAGLVGGALRAIGAVLRAAAGLDRQERGNLYLFRIKRQTVDGLRPKKQLRERKGEQSGNLRPAPVMSHRAERRCAAGLA